MISVRKLDERSITINGQGFHATWKAKTLGNEVVLESENGFELKARYDDFEVVDEDGMSHSYNSALEVMRALNEFVGNFKQAGGTAGTTSITKYADCLALVAGDNEIVFPIVFADAAALVVFIQGFAQNASVVVIYSNLTETSITLTAAADCACNILIIEK
jgi:hypothetical protein